MSDLSDFAKQLLSNDIEKSDAAINRVLDLARSGNSKGMEGLEEAICHMHGKKNIEFYTPGLAIHSGSLVANANNEILELARQKALWKTSPNYVQKLLTLSQMDGTEPRSLRSKIKEFNYCQDQVKAVQLLGLHLAVQILLYRNSPLEKAEA